MVKRVDSWSEGRICGQKGGFVVRPVDLRSDRWNGGQAGGFVIRLVHSVDSMVSAENPRTTRVPEPRCAGVKGLPRVKLPVNCTKAVYMCGCKIASACS